MQANGREFRKFNGGLGLNLAYEYESHKFDKNPSSLAKFMLKNGN